MRKLTILILLLLSSVVFAQTVGETDTPYDVDGWDSPEDSTAYYNLAIFRLLSNPGGWINRNTRTIDSLLNELIVYTDTSELVIINDTLRFNPTSLSSIVVDTSGSLYISNDTLSITAVPFFIDTTMFKIENDTLKHADYTVIENPILKTKEHGFYAFEDSTITVSIAVQNTWYQVTNATNTLFTLVQDGAGFTMSGDTITYDGGYLDEVSGLNPHLRANFSFSFEGTSANTYQFRLYNVSNTAGILPKTQGTGFGAATEISASTVTYDTNIDQNDKYILQVRNISAGNDVIIVDGAVYLEISHY